jgi:DNA-binding MarR family transcriptional regulator
LETVAMTDAVVPEEVRAFFLKTIDSVAQWEGLLLLRERPQAGGWCVPDIARDLYISEKEAHALLEPLIDRGLLEATHGEKGPCFHYRPKSAELEATVAQAAHLFRKYLIPITNIIHAKPRNRIQEFANAFRIRKD